MPLDQGSSRPTRRNNTRLGGRPYRKFLSKCWEKLYADLGELTALTNAYQFRDVPSGRSEGGLSSPGTNLEAATSGTLRASAVAGDGSPNLRAGVGTVGHGSVDMNTLAQPATADHDMETDAAVGERGIETGASSARENTFTVRPVLIVFVGVLTRF